MSKKSYQAKGGGIDPPPYYFARQEAMARPVPELIRALATSESPQTLFIIEGQLKGTSKMPTSTDTTTDFKLDDKVVIHNAGQEYDGIIGTVAQLNARVITVVVQKPITNSPYTPGNTIMLDKQFFTKVQERPKVDFDKVVLPDEKRQQILEALEQVNKADLIFKTWGFAETMEKGKGVSMLFHGPPGTGKTLMGQAIADKLGYTLKVISIADVESSAPGEAERNIRKHFKNAKGKTILLFDECDSLIFSRSMVGPIVGATINELLTQLERFEGITIFTTNRLGILDEAVNRRLALKLAFELPTHAERIEIWKRMFPKQAPLADDIDWHVLANLEISGGYIKNAVLRAARAAAIEKGSDKNKKITMPHLVRALRQEVSSMVEFEEAKQRFERQTFGGGVQVRATSGGQPDITRMQERD